MTNQPTMRDLYRELADRLRFHPPKDRHYPSDAAHWYASKATSGAAELRAETPEAGI
jgi:hypothetical protein